MTESEKATEDIRDKSTFENCILIPNEGYLDEVYYDYDKEIEEILESIYEEVLKQYTEDLEQREYEKQEMKEALNYSGIDISNL